MHTELSKEVVCLGVLLFAFRKDCNEQSKKQVKPFFCGVNRIRGSFSQYLTAIKILYFIPIACLPLWNRQTQACIKLLCITNDNSLQSFALLSLQCWLSGSADRFHPDILYFGYETVCQQFSVCLHFHLYLLSTNLKCVYIAFYNYSFFPHYAMLFYGDEGWSVNAHALVLVLLAHITLCILMLFKLVKGQVTRKSWNMIFW